MALGNILVADDDAAIRTVLNQALSRAGYSVRLTSNAATLWRWVSEGEGDLVITDVVMPDENAFDLLPRLKQARPDLPIIVMSAQNTFMTAIRASERGAYDYLPKPFDLNELIAIVGRALAEPKTRRETLPADETRREHPAGRPLAGHAGNLPRARAADADRPHRDDRGRVRHRQGTGRARAARLWQAQERPIRRHQHGGDSARPDRGGAVRSREGRVHRRRPARSAGRFEQADGGTLFLDEIGDMPMEAQTRLLRVLQQGEYTTVGGRTPVKTDVRIIAATNKDLRILINQGLFREDLFYRLNVVPIRLPPLRERSEDIPDLVRHFFTIVSKEGLPAKHIEAAAVERLKRYRWPGNVRELENLVRRLAALYPQETITEGIIEVELNQPPVGMGLPEEDNGGETLSGAVERHLYTYFKEFGDGLPPAGTLPPHIARDRSAASDGGAGLDQRESDQGGRVARGQPEHTAQEDPRHEHSRRAQYPLIPISSKALLFFEHNVVAIRTQDA